MGNNNTIETFGVHYMLDGYQADVSLLRDKAALNDILHTIPEQMGMYKICSPVVVEVGPNNRKDPGGLSGFVMIAESHISFHTFPGRKFVTIDVYTCQNDLNAKKLTDMFVQAFNIQDYDVNVVDRGTRYPATDIV